MQVNFNSSQAVKLNPLKPVQVETQPVEKKGGIMGTAGEAWIGTLKAKAVAESYTGGFVNGIKKAVFAGTALVGLDWLVTSGRNIGKGKNTFTHMIATPFVLAAKGIRNAGKVLVSVCSKDGISLPQAFKKTVWDAPKKIIKTAYASKNISKVAKIGFPILTASILAYSTFRSFLSANKQTADIDIRYRGHTVDKDKA